MPPNTESVTLAHLSDVHLSPLPGLPPRHWTVKRVLGYLNWHTRRKHVHSRAVADLLASDITDKRPDHVVVTGDLVNIGLPGEHEAALRWLEELGDPAHVTVVPGNHDIYVRLRRDPGVQRWAEYMNPDAWGMQLGADDGRAFPFARRLGPVALIGLNSAVPTPPFIAAGRLGRRQIEAAGALLSRCAEVGLVRVVLIHHPPLVGQAPPQRALADAAEFERVLLAHGAELVLHGHNHQDLVAWRWARSGHVPVVGVASGSARRRHGREPLARYNLFRLARQDGEVRIELEVRGLLGADGPVGTLGRQVLRPAPAHSAIQV